MIPAILTVRSASSRLPSKCFLPFGDTFVLDYVVRRCRYFNLLPVIATTTEPSDDPIESYCQKNGVLYFRGSASNKILRWYMLSQSFDLTAFTTIDVDDPFFCPIEVARSFKMLHQLGCDIVKPTISSSAGLATVGYSINSTCLSIVCDDIPHDADTEMVESVFEKYDLSIVELPDTNHRYFARLTLDYPEDYDMLSKLKEATSEFPLREEINCVFDKEPQIIDINLFRNSEWKSRQESLKYIPSNQFG